MKQGITLLLIFISIYAFGQNNSRAEYIEKYKDLAIKEMQRSAVPASIILAQGMHESGNGNSTLALKANNHFGIKCNSGWTGPSFKFSGKKARSKFRKYDDVEESFADHSNYLSSKKVYASLFELDPTDYKSWAIGLRKAGYATAKNYAQILIKIIEKEKLYIYDETREP